MTAKRVFDAAAATAGLIVLGWLILALVLAVRLTSPGPGLFSQIRVGRHGTAFTCWKLRTMTVDTPSRASHEVPASFVTPLGHRLRRWKLDELPQLWNVMKGEMSLVGPRPCLPAQIALVEARRARGVLQARPGVTGKAQISGIDMSDPERLARVDAAYLAERSFLGDLAILWGTVAGAGQGDRIKR